MDKEYKRLGENNPLMTRGESGKSQADTDYALDKFGLAADLRPESDFDETF